MVHGFEWLNGSRERENVLLVNQKGFELQRQEELKGNSTPEI